MKKVFSTLLALTVILSLSPVFAVTSMAEESGIWQYEVSGGEATITGVDFSVSGEVVVPSRLGGYPVTAIGDYAFHLCENLTKITVSENVTSIGDSAFWCCTGLTSVTLPSSLNSIGERAFARCEKLSSVRIPENVRWIGDIVFAGCLSLRSITVNPSNPVYRGAGNCVIEKSTGTVVVGCSSSVIPTDGSITAIGDFAFLGSSLSKIAIPSSVVSIGREAFSSCPNLTSVRIPKGVTFIDLFAFIGCSGLESITVDKGNPNYYSSGNCLIGVKYGEVMAGCKNSVIPTDGSIYYIDAYAFYNCVGLTRIKIPDSVAVIEHSAFYGCINLKDINIPYGVSEIYDETFCGCSALTSISLPDSVTAIGSDAFSYCTSLENIKFSANLEVIGSYAFQECTSLKTVNFPSNVTDIGDAALYGCTGLTAVSFPASVTSIDENVLGECPNLMSIKVDRYNTEYSGLGNCLVEKASGKLIKGCNISVIPTDGSVTSIGDGAFDGCTGLTRINIPSSVTSIGDRAFRGCTDLTSINIPASVTSIDSWAFDGCKGLTSITVDKNNPVYKSEGNCLIEKSTGNLVLGCKTSVIPTDGSVTSIGSWAFDGCTGLTSINIPSSITSIGSWAFYGCTGLTSITVDKNNPVYKSEGNCLIEKSTGNLVLGCKTSVIPTDGSVTTIGSGAFYGCTGLTSITISSGVTSIGWGAFSGCAGLTSINIPESVTEIEDDAFYGCEKLRIYGKEGSYAQAYAKEKGIPFVVVSDNPDFVCGDANGDGKVDITDAMLVLYHVAEKEHMTGNQLSRCDTNDDGKVDIVDAMKILYYVANKSDSVK